MPRLFTGLELPESLSATLAMLRGGLHGARWMTPDTYHITLRFLGDIDEATAQDALAILGQIDARNVAMNISPMVGRLRS